MKERTGADRLDDKAAFDRVWAGVLRSQVELLIHSAETLFADGAVAISRPGGVVRASFRFPGWRRSGSLRVSTVTLDGIGNDSYLPLGRQRQVRDYLLEEIRVQLAVHLAGLGNE